MRYTETKMAFDPLNLLLLAIAVIVFWRLRSVLGSRTGQERPPFDPGSVLRKSESTAKPEADNGNVIRFPGEEKRDVPLGLPDEPPPPVWKGFAEEGSDVARGLEAIALADGTFNARSFVDGAKLAYEMIIDAFAKGDRTALKPLLARDVFDGFASAITAREAAGHTVESRFVGIDKTAITAASLKDKKASVTLRFVSEMVSVTRAKDGTVVEGDDKEISEKEDVWTFERDVSSRDPNWRVVGT